MNVPQISAQRPKFVISACLLGAPVRDNGGHKESRLCSRSLNLRNAL